MIKLSNISILSIYLFLKPLYLFDSGSMQICDLLLSLAIVFYFIKRKITIPVFAKKAISLIVCFSLFASMVNTYNYYKYGDERFIYSSLFIIYNIISYYFTIILIQDIGIKKADKEFTKGCYLSLILTVVGIFFLGSVTGRFAGFFNNPNQLGLYALLMITSGVLLRDNLYGYHKIVYFVLSFISILYSGSKAAFLGLLGFAFVYYTLKDKNNIKTVIKKIMIIIILLASTIGFFFSDSQIIYSNPQLYYMKYRITNMQDEADSDLKYGRGYGRIQDLEEDILWGLGEGAYDRFSIMRGHEIHSTLASLLVSYGIIGLSIFSYFVYLNIKNKDYFITNISALSGIALYSVTHNSIRNTVLWMLLALMISKRGSNKN